MVIVPIQLIVFRMILPHVKSARNSTLFRSPSFSSPCDIQSTPLPSWNSNPVVSFRYRIQLSSLPLPLLPDFLCLLRMALNLANVKEKSHHAHQDEHESKAQTPPAIVAFRERILTGLQVFRGKVQAFLDILIHKIRPEAVYCDTSLGQRISRLVFIEPSLAHFHARRFGDTQHAVRLFDGNVQSSQAVQHFHPCLVTNISGRVTLHAQGLRASAKSRI